MKMVRRWTYCRRRALPPAEAREKTDGPRRAGEWAHEKTKKIIRTKPVCYCKERVENKNCRNEAKKYLKTRELLKNGASKAKKLFKTKHIAFWNAASLARFVRKSTPVRPEMEQERPRFAKTNRSSGIQVEAGKVTSSRLDELARNVD